MLDACLMYVYPISFLPKPGLQKRCNGFDTAGLGMGLMNSPSLQYHGLIFFSLIFEK
jgi:hypothetical protein